MATRRWLVGVVVSLCAAGVGRAGDPAALVRQLGADSYLEREAARAELARLGRHGRAAVEAGLSDPSAEVRLRCRWLWPAAVEDDIAVRLPAFVSGEGPAPDGWERFRQIAGDDRAARELFAEVAREGGAWLVESEAGGGGDELARRCLALRPGSGDTPSRAAVALLLFASGGERTRLPAAAAVALVRAAAQPTARLWAREGPHAACYGRLLFHWLDRPHEPAQLYSVLELVDSLNLADGAGVALAVARDRGAAPHHRGQGVVLAARLAGRAATAALEGLLDDASPLGSFQFDKARGTTELRDVALAMLVRVHDLDRKAYGFGLGAEHPKLASVPVYCGFATPEARAAALAKWRSAQR